MGFCHCSMFCCAFLCVHSSFAVILMWKRVLYALFCLFFWCPVIVVWLFHTMTRVCLQFVIVVFPDHTHLLFYLPGAREGECALMNGLTVNLHLFLVNILATCASPEGGQGICLLKNNKFIGILRHTGPDPLENHKAAMP